MISLSKIGWTPVRGMQLRSLEETEVTAHGLPYDRDFFLVEADGTVVMTSVGPFLPMRADYAAAGDLLEVTLPDGTVARGPAVPTGEPFVHDHGGLRLVELRYTPGPWDDLISERTGRPIRLARVTTPGNGIDVHPLSLVSRASVDDLGRRMDVEHLDSARFRSNFEITGVEPYEEESWEGLHVSIGTLVMRILSPIPRCVITTLNPQTGQRDLNVLRALKKYRKSVPLPPLTDAAGEALAVYAQVVRPGRVRVGDEVVVKRDAV